MNCRFLLLAAALVQPVLPFSPSSYLDSLSRVPQRDGIAKDKIEGGDNDDDHDAWRPFGMPAEEYYGHTNPMANTWPGSKHERYGGYLRTLHPAATRETERTDDIVPEEWYGKSNPRASWQGYKHPQFGGYLNSLQRQHTSAYCDDKNNNNNSDSWNDNASSTLPPGKPSDYGNDVRWGVDVYLNSIQRPTNPDDSN